MTSPSETIAKAMEGVTHSEWFMSPWHVEEDASAVRNASDRSYICNASSDSFAAYIASCNPVAMREVLDELYALRETALQLEAMKREMAEKDELAKALLEILAAVRDYLPPDGITDTDCLTRIIGAVDNPAINPILKKLEHDNVGA